MLIAVLGICLVLGLCSCFPSSGAEGGGSGWKPPYFETAGFSLENGRAAYEHDGVFANRAGVDVSENQDWIDWESVAADGIEFAMIRVGYRGTTEGGLFADAYYEYNLAGAQEAGVARGVYFFSQAVTVAEAQEEAQFVLSLLDGASLEYPVAFDYEQNAAGVQSRISDVSSEEATQIARAFCETIEAGGYDAMIYGNSYDLDLFAMDELGDYSLWYAEYGSAPMCRRPFTIWQYGNSGYVSGIDTAVDMNLDMSAAL